MSTDLFEMERSFLKATTAFQLKNYKYAVSELRKARAHPTLRKQAMQLLVASYDAQGLQELSKIEKENINKEFPDDGEPPTAGVTSPLKPISPKDISTAKKFPPDVS